MGRCWGAWLVLVVGALAVAGAPARAQAPDAGVAPVVPSITVGRVSTVDERVAEILAVLEARERELLTAQPEFLRWREQVSEAERRVQALEARLAALREALSQAPTLPVDASTPAGGAAPEPLVGPQPAHDPELLPQVERTLELAREYNEDLALLVETFRQEQQEVRRGQEEGAALRATLRAGLPAVTPSEKPGVDDVLRYLGDLRRATVSLSLLKARRAGLNEELDQKLKDTRGDVELPALAVFEGDPGGRAETLALREEYAAFRAARKGIRKLLRAHLTAHVDLQLQRVRLEIYEREERIAAMQQQQPRLFDQLHVTEADLAVAQARRDERLAELAREEAEVQKALKRARLSPPPEAAEDTVFTPARAWQVEVERLQHRLYLLDIEAQVARLRAAATEALYALTRGLEAPSLFLEVYAWYLDADKQAAARDELATRREAWRSEYATLALEEPPAGAEAQAAAIVGGYQAILDLYDQIDGRKWEMVWLGQLVQHHRERLARAKRDASWYGWRVGASLLLLGLVIALSRLLARGTLLPLRRREAPPGWLRATCFLAYAGGLAGLWLGLAAVVAGPVWGALFGIERVGAVFTTGLFRIGEREITLLALVSFVAVVMLTIVVNRAVGRWLERRLFAFFDWDEGVRHAIAAVARYLVLFAGVALGLEFIGVGVGALAVFAGVVGIGIGFGLQNIAANFVSGLTLLFERPIKKGDFVDAGGLEGQVIEIRARATTILTRDNLAVIVPNSEFISGCVVNWSHGSELVRVHVPVGVAYGSDVGLVTRTLLDVASRHPLVLREPAPQVWFESFGDSSLNFHLLVWTDDVAKRLDTRSDLNFAIDDAFRAASITIPFPQHDLHIRTDETKNR